MADAKIGGLMPMCSPIAVESAEGADAPEKSSPEIDTETEAYRAAAQELISAIESKDVGAVASALRTAASINALSALGPESGE